VANVQLIGSSMGVLIFLTFLGCATVPPAVSGVVAGLVLAEVLEKPEIKEQKKMLSFQGMVRETLVEDVIEDVSADVRKCSGWNDKWKPVMFEFAFEYSSADFLFKTKSVAFKSNGNDDLLKKCSDAIDLTKYQKYRDGTFPKGFDLFSYTASGTIAPKKEGVLLEKSSGLKAELFK
jgi:hypothetical protein